MQKQEPLSYEERFRDQSVGFGPHSLWSTGILPSQTILRVETYNLVCVPYQFSMQRAILLASFSAEEVAFFQRFKGSLAGLSLTVQRPDEVKPAKVFCRCQLETIGIMKGRDRIGLLALSWKPIPPDLAKVLGDHLLNLERLKADFRDFKDKPLPVNPDIAKKIGFNNYALLGSGAGQQKLALFSIAMNRLEFLLPLRSEDLAVGTDAVFTLFFQRYRFTVKGKVDRTQRLQTGVQKASAAIEFSPELVQLLSEYLMGHPVGQAQ